MSQIISIGAYIYKISRKQEQSLLDALDALNNANMDTQEGRALEEIYNSQLEFIKNNKNPIAIIDSSFMFS